MMTTSIPRARSHATCFTAVVPQSTAIEHGGLVLLDASLDAFLAQAVAFLHAQGEESLRIAAERAAGCATSTRST